MKNDQPISWEAAQTFLAVVEQGSFSGAATTLGLGQPTVSRRIAQLESSLSEQLFLRGKYGAEPTPAGRKLIPSAEQMAKWASEFVRSTQGYEPEVAGVVTIAAPPGVAVEQLAPFAAQLQQQQPNLRLEVLSAVAHLDLSRGGADIAIRTQAPNEPELTAVIHAQSQPLVVAAPAYIATLSPPCAWSDLQWITWTDSFRHVAPRPMLERAINNFVPSFSADDYLVQKAAAQAGIGAFIMGMPLMETSDANDWLVNESLAAVPMNVQLPVADFYIVCAKSAQQVPRVQAVLNALAELISSTEK